jgi:hypothetical protein
MGHRLKLRFEQRAAFPRSLKRPRFDHGIAQGSFKR